MRLPCNIVKMPDGTWKCLACSRFKAFPTSLLPRCPSWVEQQEKASRSARCAG